MRRCRILILVSAGVNYMVFYRGPFRGSYRGSFDRLNRGSFRGSF